MTVYDPLKRRTRSGRARLGNYWRGCSLKMQSKWSGITHKTASEFEQKPYAVSCARHPSESWMRQVLLRFDANHVSF